MAKIAEPMTSELNSALKRQWLVWGLLPVTVAGALATGIAAMGGALLIHGSRPQEVQLQALMALVAAAFLAGFWVEGYRTATDRIVIKLAVALDKTVGEMSAADFREHADVVREIVAEAHWSALLLGWAAAVVPVVAALAKLPVVHVGIGAVVAELYILYVLSRHHHAVEVVEAAESGDLVAEAEALARFRAFQPTALQRVWMLFGWRPTLEREEPAQAGNRKGKR
jgi:hypothetical protein